MTDLEITKLCAEALFQPNDFDQTEEGVVLIGTKTPHGFSMFEPLTNDAQAMALVKKFKTRLQIVNTGYWGVCCLESGPMSYNADLNRAICECVAKMQEAKRG